MSRKKILFFTYWYPGKKNPNSGLFVKRHAHAVSKYNDVKVLACLIQAGNAIYGRTNEIEIDENGIETHRIYIESRFYKWFFVSLPFQKFIFKKYIDNKLFPEFQFQIIHSNVLYPCAIVGNQLSKNYGVEHFITEHWSKLKKFFKVSLYSVNGLRALNEASGISCVSGFLKSELKSYVDENKISIIPNVVERSVYKIKPEIKKYDKLAFVAVAHWHPPKNPFYFLDALQQLFDQKNIPDFKMLLIGEGSLLNAIKERKYSFEIDFKGNLQATEMCNELNRCHIFLQGSDYETFSVVILEALMTGLPCVVSPVGISGEVINQNNGFVTNNSSQDWQEKILKCVNNKYDANHISEGVGDKFSLENVGILFEKMYNSVE